DRQPLPPVGRTLPGGGARRAGHRLRRIRPTAKQRGAVAQALRPRRLPTPRNRYRALRLRRGERGGARRRPRRAVERHPLRDGAPDVRGARVPPRAEDARAARQEQHRRVLLPQGAAMTSEELESAARRLQQFPSIVRRMLVGLPDDVLRSKPSADFSIAENICHLRDIEREGYSVRLRRLLDEEQPRLPNIDGARLARDRGYNSQPVPAALEDFAAERMGNVGVILGLQLEQLGRAGLLETVGEITVERLLGIMEEHDREHLQLIE